ncbi:hypothetical protein ACFFQF_00990 [Haladaptatus pallidirubidus]|uniref:Holin n=1 Tax=Haladaptatus pallidirubidus TaxID=1008152 RepID=A0AAV3UBU7_9EURY|nr:hypothetical protein [Haladaptatus pallidirubidus]
MDITLVIQSCIASVGYAFTYAIKNRQKKGQKIKLIKIAPPVLIGLGLGIVYAQTGVIPSQMAIKTRLAAMGGTVALVETLLKALINSAPHPDEL